VANLFVHKSAIHGKGLFTKVQIKKGTKMCVVADLNKYSNGENIMTDLGSLINHSKKNANCEFFEDNDSVGFVFLKPIRDIVKGEELTINYNILPFPFKSDTTGYKQ